MEANKPEEVRGPATFSKSSDIVLHDGVPLVEIAMEMTVGPCISCGALPDDTIGGVIANYRVEKGVIKGDCMCLECAEKIEPQLVEEIAFIKDPH